jgi:hypothetical protein
MVHELWHQFLQIAALYSKYTRALTFQNVCQVHELIGIRNNVVEVPGGSSSPNSKGFCFFTEFFFHRIYAQGDATPLIIFCQKNI